jgi:hypothetical protein
MASADLGLATINRTEIVRDYLAREPLANDIVYRLLSAFGHGEGLSAWVSMVPAFVEPSDPLVAAAHLTGHFSLTLGLTRLVACCLELGVADFAAYVGE